MIYITFPILIVLAIVFEARTCYKFKKRTEVLDSFSTAIEKLGNTLEKNGFNKNHQK